MEGREARIREYFYGNPRNVLHPHTCEVRFSDIKVYRIGAPPIPNTLMPLDMQKTDLETKLEPVTPGKYQNNLIHDFYIKYYKIKICFHLDIFFNYT